MSLIHINRGLPDKAASTQKRYLHLLITLCSTKERIKNVSFTQCHSFCVMDFIPLPNKSPKVKVNLLNLLKK